ncbi:hypothetical protein M9H77_01930 [Catharanthus roseus]|uniref:Uncharacterized protein n=1 Tax=Catharanthus roseus TaxID=4058 RepID=A0ACC0C7C9_CATRO|nr:hypothetical protein M9H77_01930 [Catharanthus roseus]
MSKFVGSRNKRPEVARDVPASTQKRKKVKASDWEQTEAAEGGPIDPELIPSYGGHVAGWIWRGQASRADAKELEGCWSLLEVWIYLYFPMFASPFTHSSKGCKPYMQMFPTICYKNESKLLDIRLRLDMMTADEVR